MEWDMPDMDCHPYPWVATHGYVMSPRRGSDINNVLTVGYAHDVRFTHGCIISPLRGSFGGIHCPWVNTHFRGLTPTDVLCHHDAVHMVCDTLSVGCHPCLWVNTHGCDISPLRGSNGVFAYPWVDTHGCVISPLRGSNGVFHVSVG